MELGIEEELNAFICKRTQALARPWTPPTAGIAPPPFQLCVVVALCTGPKKNRGGSHWRAVVNLKL